MTEQDSPGASGLGAAILDPASNASLGALAATRSVIDIVAARIRLRFGGREFTLPVRSIAVNRRWKEGLDASIAIALGDVEKIDEPGTLMDALVAGGDQFLDALYAYDALPVGDRGDGLTANSLPPREDLEELAFPLDPLSAVATIWRAANPLADMTVALMNQTPVDQNSPAPTNGHRRPTTGRRRRSKKS